ncbi:HNH endonuclease [Azospirillum baldaniorum]|uniref:HNH endonuclease n=1 Tax=Azospirillum baldaniorum TaxID=1064539 RepID=UPI00119FE118|nr:HNH endonuclease [Azospirillum baldaniorum]TWA71863.1 HNH endonuclease [Azospirillum baldaniorum]
MTAILPTGVDAFRKRLPKFKDFLEARGAEVLAPSNPFELARFTTPQGVGVIYRNGKGQISSWQGGADEAFAAFQTGGSWSVSARKAKGKVRHQINALLARDGDRCFFCGAPLGDDITVEHLVPAVHGGPNHISNLVLAHAACNQAVGHLSVSEKVRARDRMTAAAKEGAPA